MITQKEAVFNAVVSIMGDAFSEGMDCGAWFKAHPEAKAQLQATVLEGANSTYDVKSEQENMNTYVQGLISNHLRKDTRINGGDKYVAANPGSRAGQGDTEIKAARAAIKTFAEGDPRIEQFQSFIDTKLATIKAAKAVKEIDLDSLPEELKALVG